VFVRRWRSRLAGVSGLGMVARVVSEEEIAADHENQSHRNGDTELHIRAHTLSPDDGTLDRTCGDDVRASMPA
jgi:hypothetical protein